MKKKNIYTLDADDDKAVQLFVKLGMPKNLAKTLLYISQFDECKCADIEHGADLRQPEVSRSMQELRKKGWIKSEILKRKRKADQFISIDIQLIYLKYRKLLSWKN